MKKIIYSLFITFIFLIGNQYVKALTYCKYSNGNEYWNIKISEKDEKAYIIYDNGKKDKKIKLSEVMENGECKKYLKTKSGVINTSFEFNNTKLDVTSKKEKLYILNNKRYGEANCHYTLPHNIGSIEFYLSSDGQNVFMDVEKNYKHKSRNGDDRVFDANPNNKYTGEVFLKYNYSSSHFINDNKFVCPNILYYTIDNDKLYNFSFAEGEHKISTDISNNKMNGKPVLFLDNTDVLSCSYKSNIYNFNVLYVGTKVWYEYISGYEIKKFDVSSDIFKNNECPALNIDCASGKFGGKCDITSLTEGDLGVAGDKNYNVYKTNYVDFLKALKTPLFYLNKKSLSKPYYLLLDGNPNFTLEMLDDNITNENIRLCDEEECKLNSSYYVDVGFKHIERYCNDIYSNYIYHKNDEYFTARKNECRAFDKFYKSLIADGIVNDLRVGCEIVGDDFANFLIKILNIVKIAGPIIAIVLSSIDFIKVFVQDDADKEMKTALKRFTTRIIAAVMLFLVPFVLAFLMDLFLKNQPGYDKENPFCMEIDWEKE